MKNLNSWEKHFVKELSLTEITGKHIICVAQPKTGSTFLVRSIQDLVGWNLIPYSTEHENYRSYSLDMFKKVCKKNGVVHLHSFPSALLTASAISVAPGVIILKRNFIEYCHSFLAHIKRGQPTFLQYKVNAMSKRDALKFIALQEFGWVFRFFQTWEGYSERVIKDNGEKFFKIIDHSELFSDTELILSDCLKHVGHRADERQINDVIQNMKQNNKKSNYHQTTFDYDEAAEYEFFKDMKNLAPKLFLRPS